MSGKPRTDKEGGGDKMSKEEREREREADRLVLSDEEDDGKANRKTADEVLQ